MSLSGALTSAISGLQVSTTLLQLTSNNIANAQTAGYTKKDASLSTVQLGNFAGGVQVGTYTRATNTALSTSLNNATSSSSYLSTQNSYLKQIQTFLGSSSNPPPLAGAIANFQSAWTNFQSAPEDQAQQIAVVQAGQAIATQVQSIMSGVNQMGRQVRSDIGTSITSLNSDLQQISALNKQIAQQGPGVQTTGNLEDQRDQLINQVSQITNVVVMPRGQGQVALYTSDGVQLVDTEAQVFSYNGTNITTASGGVVTNDLVGGSLQAQVQFIATASAANTSTNPGNQVLSKLTSQLSMLAYQFTDTSNPNSFAAAYNAATSSGNELTSGFFTVGTDLSTGLPDPSTFQVNPALINGTNSVKQASGTPVAASLTASFAYPPTSPAGLGLGLASTTGTYTDMGTAVISYFQQAANTVSNQSATATQQQQYYQQSLSDATGVNVDTELVNLTTLQNSYAASAHVISTVSQMFQDLTNIIA